MKDVTGASLHHEVHVGDEVMSIDAKTLCDSDDRQVPGPGTRHA